MGTGSSNSMNHKFLEINMLEQVVVGPVNPGELISHEQILARTNHKQTVCKQGTQRPREARHGRPRPLYASAFLMAMYAVTNVNYFHTNIFTNTMQANSITQYAVHSNRLNMYISSQ